MDSYRLITAKCVGSHNFDVGGIFAIGSKYCRDNILSDCFLQMPPIVQKRRHSLRGKNILPVTKHLRGHQGELVSQARMKSTTATETLGPADAKRHFQTLTGESCTEILEMTGRESSTEIYSWRCISPLWSPTTWAGQSARHWRRFLRVHRYVSPVVNAIISCTRVSFVAK